MGGTAVGIDWLASSSSHIWATKRGYWQKTSYRPTCCDSSLTSEQKKIFNVVISNIVGYHGPFKHHKTFSNEGGRKKKVIGVLYWGRG